LKIRAPELQSINDKTLVIIPDGSKFPFAKIRLDFIFCSHKTWIENKYIILKNCLTKPKIIFID
jgi:hypothetical protein